MNGLDTEPRLFDVDVIDPGSWAVGLPSNTEFNARARALQKLREAPRYTQSFPDEDREVVFRPEDNSWADWRGSMCVVVRPESIAHTAMRSYLNAMGAAPQRFDAELAELSAEVAYEYALGYPPQQEVA